MLRQNKASRLTKGTCPEHLSSSKEASSEQLPNPS